MKQLFKLFLFNFFCLFFFYSFSSGQIIKEIKISGNERISDETVVMFSGLEIGENLKDSDFNKVLNNLNLKKVNSKIFPMIKLLKLLPKKHSLFETVIVAANDKLVELFLENKIRFIDIQKKLFKIILSKEFLIFKRKYPNNFDDIVNLNNYVRLKISQNKI